LPGQLAIYNSRKEYIRDLIQYERVSQRSVGDEDWVFLYGGSHIGTEIGFRAGYPPEAKYAGMSEILPSGQYYIQLILYKAFFSTNPNHLSGERVDFHKSFDRSEALRSNLIKIELVDE
jgi:hypothetical protein